MAFPGPIQDRTDLCPEVGSYIFTSCALESKPFKEAEGDSFAQNEDFTYFKPDTLYPL